MAILKNCLNQKQKMNKLLTTMQPKKNIRDDKPISELPEIKTIQSIALAISTGHNNFAPG